MQGLCKAKDHANGRLIYSPLDKADEVALHLSLKAKLFLCQLSFNTETP